jgi:hypothetical protein
MLIFVICEGKWFGLDIGLGEVDDGKIRFLMWDKVVEALIGATWIHVAMSSSNYGCTL